MTPEQAEELRGRMNLYPSLQGLAQTVKLLAEIVLQQQKQIDSLIIRKQLDI